MMVMVSGEVLAVARGCQWAKTLDFVLELPLVVELVALLELGLEMVSELSMDLEMVGWLELMLVNQWEPDSDLGC